MLTKEGKPPASTPSTRKFSFSKFILRLVLILIAAVALLECALRFGLGLGNPVLITPDQACAYILKPNQSLFRFFVHTRINSYGMRSDPVPATKDPHTARLFFLGDSISYGTTRVDQDKIFTERIHHDLPALIGAPVEVLNASASAWAIDNELSYVQSRGLFHSDLLVLVLNSGDPAQSRSTIASVGDALARVKPDFAIEELYDKTLKRRIQRIAEHIDAGDTAQENAGAIVQENLAKLNQLKKYSDDQKMGLVVVYVPFRNTLENGNAANLAIVKSWTDSTSVPLIDLTPLETKYTAKEITLEGVHLNEKGNELAAQQIEQALAALHSQHKILQQFP